MWEHKWGYRHVLSLRRNRGDDVLEIMSSTSTGFLNLIVLRRPSRTLGNDPVEYINKDYEKMPEHLVMSRSKKGQ